MKFKNKKFTLISALISTGVITSLVTIAGTSCSSINEVRVSNDNLENNIYSPVNAAYVTLTFDANGGAITGSKTIKMRSGKPFGSITPPKATKEGATFIGWFDAATGGNKMEPTTTIDASKVVYAHWDTIIETKTLTFSAGTTGATLKGPTEVIIHEGETFANVARPDVFLEGFDFKCWHYGSADIETESSLTYADFSSTEQNTITPVFADPKAQYIEITTDDASSNDEIALQYSSTLTATVYGQEGVSDDVVWSTSDDTTLGINENGVLTPKKEGTADITATSADGLATATKTIHVVKPYVKYTDEIYVVEQTTPQITYWVADQSTLCDENGEKVIELTKAGQTSTTKDVTRSEFDMSIYVGTDVLALNDYFLYGCSAFGTTSSTSLTILSEGSRLTFIGDLFMGDCANWTKNINLPSSLKYIGNDFMSGCTGVTEATMPASLLYVGESFMVDCESLTKLTVNCNASVFADSHHIDTLTVTDNTAAAYDTGIQLLGNGATGFKDKFPELHDGPLYRNYQ